MCYTGGAVNEILTIKEAAALLHKHPDTLRRWIHAKKLKAKKISAGAEGVYVILKSDLLELVIEEEAKAKSRLRKPHAIPQDSSQQELLPI